jgi:hypothetical protein
MNQTTNALKTDGPTLAEWIAAGYKAETYPPKGYAPRTAMRYFHADNSNRLIQGDGKSFQFHSYQLLHGSWSGVYATKDEQELKALEGLVANPKSAVTEISAQEYERCRQKKISSDKSSTLLIAPAPPGPMTSMVQDAIGAGSTVETVIPGPEQPIVAAPVADPISIGNVTTGATEVAAPTPIQGADLS